MSLEDRCYLAIGTLPMQMQKLMSSVNGVPLRRKPLTVSRKKANTDWGETPLNNQPDYNISSRPPQL